jgi:hypothetical protein
MILEELLATFGDGGIAWQNVLLGSLGMPGSWLHTVEAGGLGGGVGAGNATWLKPVAFGAAALLL